MPIHDWTKVVAGNFHDFHQRWAIAISELLNEGVLPAPYYALAEQRAKGPEPDVLALEMTASPDPHSTLIAGTVNEGGVAIAEHPPQVRFEEQMDEAAYYASIADHVAIFHANGDQVVAYLEIISPGNKQSSSALRDFRQKFEQALRRGCHFLMIDILPPGRHDPQGMHRECWDYNDQSLCVVTSDEPFGFSSYVAADIPHAYFDRAGLRQPVPKMPLFLTKHRYVDVPLEEAYQKAWRGVPDRWKKVLEAEK